MRNYDYDPYYDDVCDECGHCKEYSTEKDYAADFMKGILDHLYGDKALDLKNLEHCLEELAHILQVKFPEKDLTIRRETPKFLQEWVNFNNNYLKQIA